MEKNFNYRSWVEIDVNKLKNNVNEIKKYLYDNEDIIAVIKANAYGHDDASMAVALHEAGINNFAVASLNEAKNIRSKISDSSIVILGYTPYAKADELVKYNICQTITSKEYLENLYKYSKEKIKIHIAIDTGMARIGLSAKNVGESIKLIEEAMEYYDVDGMFTHMTSADDCNEDAYQLSLKQIELFRPFVNHFKDRIRMIHYKNSSGLIRKFENLGNYARAGIILYGLYPSDDMRKFIKLEPILSWYSVVTSVRKVLKGEMVSYNGLYVAPKDMMVASVACGYSDGYRREMTNKPYVLINGKKAPQIGRICMDQFMVDVSDIEDVGVGTVVVLIGSDNGLYIDAQNLASLANTNHYDLLSNISIRVERIFKY